MSQVSNIILTTSFLEDINDDDENPNVDKINKWFIDNNHKSKLINVSDYSQSSKCIECQIFITTVNYLDHYALIDALNNIEWEYYDAVQLMIKGQEDHLFDVYSFFSKKNGGYDLKKWDNWQNGKDTESEFYRN